MTKSAAEKAELKLKAKHELRELTIIFVYLAFFFCALITYDMLLLHKSHVEGLTYAFALINALIITKVIMIGEYAHVGKRGETKALILSALWKAFLFSWLVFAFHVVEEVIKRLIHGAAMAEASRELRLEELAGRSIVVFCTFIPLFGFREFQRVLGEEKFYQILFHSEEAGRSDRSTGN